MSMTQMKTAIISLIVSNITTPVGVFIVGVGVLLLCIQMHKMIKERDFYRIVFILLLILLTIICLIAAQEILEYIVLAINWVRSKF